MNAKGGLKLVTLGFIRQFSQMYLDTRNNTIYLKAMKKSILVKQRDITDCGAACLASVAAYYDLYLSVAQNTTNRHHGSPGY